MKIFFDTEFTGLHKNTSLISIGLIDENGRNFYAEFTDYDKSQCNEWIKKNVIDHLFWNQTNKFWEGGLTKECEWFKIKSNKNTILYTLNNWLSVYDNVEFVSDVCHYDMVLLIDLFGTAFDLPKNINPACHDINQDIARYYEISETEAFDFSREEILQTMDDLLSVGCSVMTIGQYLQPTKDNYPLQEYIHPDVFAEYAVIGKEKGFLYIESSPLVRSSYHAEKHIH